jgi:hypothetical protein
MKSTIVKKKFTSKDQWEVTNNRFVAFIDIMGFKDMVARSSHSDIYKIMLEIAESKKLNENTKWHNSDMTLVRSATYSDSIMIYSKDEKLDSLDSLICTVSGLTTDLFINEIPHKGAISYGLMTLDFENSIFFGQPLIDAYLLAEELYFYGIIVHGSAEQKINAHIKNLGFIINYLCPLKNGTVNHQTVYPMFLPLIEEEDKVNPLTVTLRKSIEKLRYKTSGNIRKYVDNTDLYFDFVIENV